VGQSERIKNVSSSIVFKGNIKKQVETIINNNPAPDDVEASPDKWKTYVMSQIEILTNKR